MEMTIEKAHEILSNGLVNAPSEHEWCVAFKMAIDTLCKYQKIEQVLKSLDDGEINYPQMTYYLREVLEDGKID